MRDAIAAALEPPSEADIQALVDRREDAANIYYTGG
jgi:hypothetical protein